MYLGGCFRDRAIQPAGMNAGRRVCPSVPWTENGFPSPFRLGAEGVRTGNGSTSKTGNGRKHERATENDQSPPLPPVSASSEDRVA